MNGSPLRELLVGFGIDVQGKEKLDGVDSKIDSIIGKFRTMGRAAAAAFAFKEIASFISDTIEMGRTLGLTADKLDVSVEDLERFRYAAQMSGVDTEAADMALMRFNRTLGEAKAGSKKSAAAIAEVAGGLSETQLASLSLPDLMGRVADKFKGITDKGERAQLAMKLFGRRGADLIPLLDKGSEKLVEFSKEFDELGGGVGKQFTKDALEAGNAMRRLSFAWDVAKAKLVTGIIPWIKTLSGVLIEGAKLMQELGKRTYVAKTSLIALGAAAAVALAPFLLSILPIVAAMGALYLAFDDIFTLFEGGDSYSGDLLDKLFGPGGAKAFVKAVKEAWQSVKEAVRSAYEYLQTVDLSAAWKKGLEGLHLYGDAIHAIWVELKGIVAMLADLASFRFAKAADDMADAQHRAEQIVAGGPLDSDLDDAARAERRKKTDQELNESADKFRATLYKANQMKKRSPLDGGSSMPLPASMGAGADAAPPGATQVTHTGDIHIKVEGVTDAQAAAEAVELKLREQYGMAATSLPPHPATKTQGN